MARDTEKIADILDTTWLQAALSNLSHTVAIERFGPWISRRISWQGDASQPRIALTFDDGPQPEFTPSLLEILEKHGVAATFFLIGRHIESNLPLAERIAKSGHELANHTYTHPLMWRLPDQQLVIEINRTHQLLQSLNGQRPKYLRPPMGLFTPRVLDVIEHTGYRAVVGDVYPRDPDRPGRERILARILKRVRNGSIIILHDGGNTRKVDRSQTLWAVDRLIPRLRERGFELVTLSELLAPPQA